MAIDSKNVYYIVEYLSYANPTLKEKDVRAMLDQIPAQKWTPLVLTATAWRNEACSAASKTFLDLVGDQDLPVFEEMARIAKYPAGKVPKVDPTKTRRK